MNSLRTPSIDYNHGGYYGPTDPTQCDCLTCSDRATMDAALALLMLSRPCCDRPYFLEPCPFCPARLKRQNAVRENTQGSLSRASCED